MEKCENYRVFLYLVEGFTQELDYLGQKYVNRAVLAFYGNIGITTLDPLLVKGAGTKGLVKVSLKQYSNSSSM